jgi:hypothetical protein
MSAVESELRAFLGIDGFTILVVLLLIGTVLMHEASAPQDGMITAA